MSKKTRLFSVALAVFVVVLLTFAGTALASYNTATHTADHSAVAGSVHDKSTADDPNPCDSCHVPHGANPATGFLWANPLKADASGMTGGVTPNDDAGVSTTIKPLCYSCHDGTVATKGVARVFSDSHTNHRTRSSTALTSSGAAYGPGRDCDLCHDPHDDGNKNFRNADGTTSQSWTGSSSFLKYERYSSHNTPAGWSSLYPGGNFCGSCHSANMANSATAKTHPLGVVPGANTALSHAPTNSTWLPEIGIYQGTRLFNPSTQLVSTATNAVVACESCHSPHGAEPSATYTSTSGSGVVSTIHSLNTMIVKPFSVGTPPVAQPYLCINCH